MSELLQDKPHPASPARRKRAREQGHVAKSHDLTVAAALLAGSLSLWMFGSELFTTLALLMRGLLGSQAWLRADRDFIGDVLVWLAGPLAAALLPPLVLMLAAALCVELAQVGFQWLPGRAAPDWSRLSLGRGWSRIGSLDGSLRLGLAVAKLLTVVGVTIWCIWSGIDALSRIAAADTPGLAVHLGRFLQSTTLTVGVSLLVLAGVEYAYRYWKLQRDLRMTDEEFRDELRDAEGDPQLTARRRSVQAATAASAAANLERPPRRTQDRPQTTTLR